MCSSAPAICCARTAAPNCTMPAMSRPAAAPYGGRGRGVEPHRIARLAGEAGSGVDRDRAGRHQRHRRDAVVLGEHDDMPGIARKWNLPRAAAQCALGQLDTPVGEDRSNRHRPGRRLDPGLREQPAGHQCLCERHRRVRATGRAQYREPVEQFGPGAAERVGDPGQRQTGFLERVPQRFRPGAFLGGVDRRRLAQIGEDAGRGIDDDAVCHDPCSAVRMRLGRRQGFR